MSDKAKLTHESAREQDSIVVIDNKTFIVHKQNATTLEKPVEMKRKRESDLNEGRCGAAKASRASA